MNPATPGAPDPFVRAITWGAVVVSKVPDIIWRDSGHRMSLPFSATVSLLIIVTAVVLRTFPRLRGLTRFLLAVAALNFA